MAGEKPDVVKLTREQEANFQRHLRHQKRERTREEGIATGMKSGLRLLRFVPRLLVLTIGISMIVKANNLSSIDPAMGMFVIPLLFVGICLVVFALFGTWGFLALLHLTFRD